MHRPQCDPFLKVSEYTLQACVQAAVVVLLSNQIATCQDHLTSKPHALSLGVFVSVSNRVGWRWDTIKAGITLEEGTYRQPGSVAQNLDKDAERAESLL